MESKNRIIILSVFLSISINNAFTQNINVDNDCLSFNTTIFTQYLTDFKGKDFVSELLDNDIYFILYLIVDSSGCVLELERIRTQCELPEHFKEELSHRFKTHPISFFICYQYLPGKTNEEACDIIRKGWSDENEGRLTDKVFVGFPGVLMISYEYQKEKAKKRGVSLSKYDYLMSEIEPYKNKMEKYMNKNSESDNAGINMKQTKECIQSILNKLQRIIDLCNK